MINRRSLEVVTGLLTGAFGLAVIVSSIEVGSGWSAGGVESGTFPLLAGLLVLGGSVVNLAGGFRGSNPVLIAPGEARRIAGLFLPALAFVAAIPVVGLYVACAAYLLFAMSVQHEAPWWRSGLITLAALATLYWLFEATFQVLMPRGWLGRALGF